ncbi:hypothetical protein [Immundisolibacter sp.]|nr:hypothetical protein [Immundisolibacter sp.]MDD3650251.1 hypothetical protein [Immundisolibacter sp.]
MARSPVNRNTRPNRRFVGGLVALVVVIYVVTILVQLRATHGG